MKIYTFILLLISFKILVAQTQILIDKSDYSLVLIVDSDTIKKYPVVFGKNPVDDKRRQGDTCTPEGSFGIRSKYKHKK